MKWLGLIGAILWLTGCAAGDQSSTSLTLLPTELTPRLRPTQPIELTPTFGVTVTPMLISVATRPIEPAAIPTVTAPLQATATTAPPSCQPLPEPESTKTQAAVQHFEHGLMFWLHDRNEIWVLVDSSTANQLYWRIVPDAWSDNQPESDPAIQPPVGFFQPIRGFGYAWRAGGGSFGPQRADLGWAVHEEIGFETTLTYYPQGFYSPDCVWMPKSGIYELEDEHGTVYRFVGAGGIARRITQ